MLQLIFSPAHSQIWRHVVLCSVTKNKECQAYGITFTHQTTRQGDFTLCSSVWQCFSLRRFYLEKIEVICVLQKPPGLLFVCRLFWCTAQNVLGSKRRTHSGCYTKLCEAGPIYLTHLPRVLVYTSQPLKSGFLILPSAASHRFLFLFQKRPCILKS